MGVMKDLAKRLDDESLHLFGRGNKPEGPTLVRDQDEAAASPYPEHQVRLQQHLEQPEVAPPGFLHAGTAFKRVVKTPDGDRWLLKPYHEPHALATVQYPLTGWAEMTNQAVWHAAGLGDHHQQVHVQHLDDHGRSQPVVAIRMAPGYKTLWDLPGQTPEQRTDHLHDDAHRLQVHKMGILDTLLDQRDRHDENLMVGPGDHLLAIDHGGGGNYATGWGKFHTSPKTIYMGGALQAIGGPQPELDKVAPQVLDWWRQVSPQVRAAHEKRLKLVKHGALRQHLRNNFNQRADHLDQAAAANDLDGFWNGAVEPIQTPGTPNRLVVGASKLMNTSTQLTKPSNAE